MPSTFDNGSGAAFDGTATEPTGPGADALSLMRGNKIAGSNKRGPFLTPEQATKMSTAVAAMPELSEAQHRAAMAQALANREPEHHTTGAGGFMGAIASGLRGYNAKTAQDAYGQQLQGMRDPQQQYMEAMLRAMGVVADPAAAQQAVSERAPGAQASSWLPMSES